MDHAGATRPLQSLAWGIKLKIMANSKKEKKELVVIGAGPGGYAAAFRAADLGIKTTLKSLVACNEGEKRGYRIIEFRVKF